MILLIGTLRCLRGFLHQQKLKFLDVNHSEEHIIFQMISGPMPRPTLAIPKEKIVTMDLLLPENLEDKCKSRVKENLYGETLFGSAHLFMDGKWEHDGLVEKPVKCILCITYKGETEEEIETIYLTAGIRYCRKMLEKLERALKAPPEYYRDDNTGGDSGESTYRYMGEY